MSDTTPFEQAIVDVINGADPIATADALVAGATPADVPPETTEIAPAPSGRPRVELHDSCPLCGHRFTKPQARCQSKSACEKRAAARAAGEPVHEGRTTQPADAAGKAEAKARIEDRAAARKAGTTPEQEAKGEREPAGDRTPELATLLNHPRPEFRVEVRTDAQVKLVDELFPGQDAGSTLRSGRAGKRLLVQDGEADVVRDRIVAAMDRALETVSEAGAELPSAERETLRRRASTAEAILRSFDAARPGQESATA